MADSPIDYAVVLADLRAKRDQLDNAIAAIEAMTGLKASLSSSSTMTAALSTGTDLGPGAFLGMRIVDAAAKLLAARRQALRTEEICSELRRGGIAFATETPVNTVGSVLNRDFKQGGEIVSVGRGQWALAEWHPRLRRKRPQNGSAATLGEIVDAAVDESVETTTESVETQPERATATKPKSVDDLDDDIPF